MVNVTPYSGVIFWGVILTPDWELKELFFRSKNDPNLELNPVFKIFTPFLEV